MLEQFGSGTTTLKLRGITLKQYSDTEFTFEITASDIIPVIETLKNKNGKIKGRISPIKTPTETITHLAFAVLPTKNMEDEL